MRELTFGIFIIFTLLISANSTKPNATDARAEYQEPDIRVEHLKKYCNVKNWKKKMPDWLMFRTGSGLRRTFLLRVDIIWMVSHNAIEIGNAWVDLRLR